MSAADARGPVPEGNRPGHHPAHEQDKPDPEAFARRLGLADEPAAAHPPVEDHGAGTSRPSRAREASPPFTGPAPASPVEPAELVAEAVELSLRAAVAVAFLPWRLAAATVKAGLRIARSD